MDESKEPARGAAIGRYLVVDRLGAGGMGVVYAAYDPELDRKVALKLVRPRPGRDSDSAGRTRLLREAQALAKLSHPNVVTVHDVGTHGDQIWIAMEFVAGDTLGAWAKMRPRQWQEILRILSDAARGVSAAHAAGLIHRDLKPDNIMIGHDGRVRVMDFGLVQGRTITITDPDLVPTLSQDVMMRPEIAALAVRLTAVGAIQGTPAYMAPEQWLGKDVEAATDQFGWSVMAWELLFGARPFQGPNVVVLAARVLLGQRQPPPGGRSVPGWLRRVIERGLTSEPAKRWPTMAAMLAALERGRLWARVRVAATIVLGTALLVAGWIAYHRWDLARSETARLEELARHETACRDAGATIEAVWSDDARRQLRVAFAATGVVHADTSAEKVIPWLDRLTDAWSYSRTEACRSADDLIGARWSAETLDRALWCLEDQHNALESLIEQFGQASPALVKIAVPSAAGLKNPRACLDEDLLARQPTPPTLGRESIRDVRATLWYARTLQLAGDPREALTLASEASEQARAIHWPPLWASARTLEGRLLGQAGEHETAERVSAEAYFEAARSGAWAVATDAGVNLIYIVGVQQMRTADGRAWAQHAELAISHAGDWEDLREAKRLYNLALVRSAEGAYTDAQALLTRSLTLLENALGSEHPDVAANLNQLATLHNTNGNFAESRALSERAIAITERTEGLDHPDVAAYLNNLANVHEATGAYTTAREMHERVLAILERANGPDHPDVAVCLNDLAIVHMAMGAHAEARALLERAQSIKEKTLRPDHPSVGDSLNNLADVYQATGALAEARALHERALAIYEKAFGPDHPDVALSLFNLANLSLADGQPRDALPLFERAVGILDGNPGTQLGEFEAHFGLAQALLAAHVDRPRALAEARKARDGFRDSSADTSKELAEVEQWLAQHQPQR